MARVFYSAVVVLLLTAGCVRRTPETPPPAPPPAAAPVEKTPAPTTKEPTTKEKAAPPATKAPTKAPAPKAQPKAQAPAPKAQTPKQTGPGTTSLPPRQTAASQALDLDALTTQLKETKAIGIFTKLTLKNQVDDLLDEFRDHHAGKPKPTMPELRRSYDLLMMKVLSLLQDDDQKLASAIVSSREKIWGLLADPKKFATLHT